MHKNIVGLLAVALIWVCGVAAATPIVYNVNITDGTETVSGTITTDGMIGTLVAGDVTNWALSATGPVALSINSTLPGAIVDCDSMPSCGLVATADGGLEYDFSNPTALIEFFIIPGPPGVVIHAGGVTIYLLAIPGNPPPYDISIPGGLRQIGTASVAEPGTLTLLGLALAGLGFARKRFRGRKSTAV
jgi:PEP-CTERM motif